MTLRTKPSVRKTPITRLLGSTHPAFVALIVLVTVGAGAAIAAQITGRQIKNGSIASRDLKNNDVRSADLQNRGVRTADIALNAITSAQVKDGALTSADLAPGTISASSLAAGSVGGTVLADGSISAEKLAADSVGSGAIAAKSIGVSERAATPAAVATRSAQSIGTGGIVATPINLTSEQFDNAGIHSLLAQQNRMTAPVDGIYAASGMVRWEANAVGARFAGIQHNLASGALVRAVATDSGAAFNVGVLTNDHSVSALVALNAGEYLELVAYQSSGGALNVATASMSVHWVGPLS